MNTTNTNNNNNHNSTQYTPREKFMHLISLLPHNTEKNKEEKVSTLNKLYLGFSNLLGISEPDNKTNATNNNVTSTTPTNSTANKKDANNNTATITSIPELPYLDRELDDDEFVLMRSNEDITNEMKDEEFARALQKQENDLYQKELRRRADQERDERRRDVERRRREDERRRRESEQRQFQQRAAAMPPDLFTMLMYGLDLDPPRSRFPPPPNENSTSRMYFIPNIQPPRYPQPQYQSLYQAQPQPQSQPQSQGVQNVDMLPSHVFNGQQLPVEKNSCTICLNEFHRGEVLKTLPCLHIYHSDCINEWMQVSRTCPICKNSIE